MCSEHMSLYGKWRTDDWGSVVIPYGCSTWVKAYKPHHNGSNSKGTCVKVAYNCFTYPPQPSYTHTHTHTHKHTHTHTYTQRRVQNFALEFKIPQSLHYSTFQLQDNFPFSHPKYLTVKKWFNNDNGMFLWQNYMC